MGKEGEIMNVYQEGGGEVRDPKFLSKREQQIKDFREQGWLVEAIAQQLGISPRTVHVHLANIRRKIGPPTAYWRYETPGETYPVCSVNVKRVKTIEEVMP